MTASSRVALQRIDGVGVAGWLVAVPQPFVDLVGEEPQVVAPAEIEQSVLLLGCRHPPERIRG